MKGRPPKFSDEEIFAGAMRALARYGRADVTLADIAAEVDVTAGALNQRFGSKRDLLLWVMERFAGSVAAIFAGLRTSSGSPLKAILAYGRAMAAIGASPKALSHTLGWLQSELADPDFRRHLLAQGRATRRELRKLVEEAAECGELGADTPAPALARLIDATVSGSLVTWAIHQEGTCSAWVARDLRALLAPWRAGDRADD